MTPVQRHRQQMLGQVAATQAATAAGLRTGAAASAYELMRARLGVDLRRLRELQSIERKIDLKRELLPEYDAWIEGVLVAGADSSSIQDDIVAQIMIWRIDVGDYAGALPLCRFVLDHKLDLPERFDRTAPTLICEEIADAALKAIGQGETFDLEVLAAVEDMVSDEDIFDQVRAKLEKAIGLLLATRAETIEADADGPAGARRAALDSAQSHLRRALELDGNVGVKKRLEQLQREITKQTAPATQVETQTNQGGETTS